jgi:hypothetical protein
MEPLVNRGQSQLSGGERITAPSSKPHDMTTMVRTVKTGNRIEGTAALERLSAIKAQPASADTIVLARIEALTSISGHDSAHAEEVLAGAHVHGLLPQDPSV